MKITLNLDHVALVSLCSLKKSDHFGNRMPKSELPVESLKSVDIF